MADTTSDYLDDNLTRLRVLPLNGDLLKLTTLLGECVGSVGLGWSEDHGVIILR